MTDSTGGIAVAIDPTSSTAPFEQLRAGLVAAVSSGELAAGQRLPTVRRLADDLGVAAGTVARAYRELEASGIIETRGRNGTFVSFSTDPAQQQAERAASVFAERIRALGVDPDEAIRLVSVAVGRGA